MEKVIFFDIMDCRASLAMSRTLCVLTDVLLRKSHDAVGYGAPLVHRRGQGFGTGLEEDER